MATLNHPKGAPDSRAQLNAMRTLMLAQIVLPHERLERRNDRARAWKESIQPANAFEEYMVEQAVVSSMGVEQAQVAAFARMAELADLAAMDGPLWENEQQLNAACLAETLSRNPAKVVSSLRQTPFGRQWLLKTYRNHALLYSGDPTLRLDPTRLRRVVDLLGVCKSEREAVIEYMAKNLTHGDLREKFAALIAELEKMQANQQEEIEQLRLEHRKGKVSPDDYELVRIKRREREEEREFRQFLKHVGVHAPRVADIVKEFVAESTGKAGKPKSERQSAAKAAPSADAIAASLNLPTNPSIKASQPPAQGVPATQVRTANVAAANSAATKVATDTHLATCAASMPSTDRKFQPFLAARLTDAIAPPASQPTKAKTSAEISQSRPDLKPERETRSYEERKKRPKPLTAREARKLRKEQRLHERNRKR